MIELSVKSSPLNSTTIYHKCDHTLYSVSITKNKMALWMSPLPWAYFIFLFLLFQIRSLITFITCPPTTPWTSSCSTTWIGPSYLVTHLDARISPNRFHQLAKTKLWLSISPFLVIDDNLYKDMKQIQIWIHVACPSIFTMCKGFGQDSWTELHGSICSPYICAKSLDYKLAHMHRFELWESNVYQMMLMYKRWTFEAWYQS